MATSTQYRFSLSFGIAACACLALNLLAAHLRSDCGLGAILGVLHCSDDIRRAGFPLQFWEQGGFVYREWFDSSALIVDILSGIGLSLVAGAVSQRSVRPVVPTKG